MHFVEAKGILSAQNGMNVYRGCTHGCIYCDSRSKCYNMSHDFEDIEVKKNAPELLYAALRSKRRRCMIGTGAMCDPYMQCEKELRITRRCLEIIEREGFGAAVQTKSPFVLRDAELLSQINRNAKSVVQITLTTFDDALCKIVEPNVAATSLRAEALCVLREKKIPTVVWLSPLLPYINDTEENLRGILGLCFDAGVRGILNFGIGLTLREGNREYFYSELDRHFPGLKQRYIRAFGEAYECESSQNPRLMRIFHDECEKHGVMHNNAQIFSYLHELPEEEQLSLF